MTGQYKVISDNLGEYSVVSKDNVIVVTEIQHRITAETFCEELNIFAEENEQLKKELFETSKELLWATSDEVDRALHYEDEVEELRREIFE